MTALEPGQTYLRRLRLRGGEADPLAARQRLERLLATALRHPPGLPPGAVLCVRHSRLLLESAGRLSVAPDRVAAVGQAGNALDRAVAGWLEGLVRRAARPALGGVPSAAAVLFADQAELLACLAADWLSGALGERWWWRGLFPGLGGTQALLAGWRRAPQFQPAALEWLARRRRAVEFARRLEPVVARSLLAGLLQAFALPDLAAALFAAPALQILYASPGGMALPEPPSNAWEQASVSPPTGAKWGMSRENLPPPWRSASPEAGASALAPAQAAFLGVGLALQRASAAVRSASFSAAARRWGASLLLPASDAAGGGARPLSPPSSASASPAATFEAGYIPEPGFAASSSLSVPAPGETGLPAHPVSLPAAVEAVSQPPASPEASLDVEGLLVQELPLAETVETRFGGLFYLLNLALYLGLYGDFTAPAKPGIALSPWDWLALAGRAWSGAEIEADPLWVLLARLAGRPAHQPPGAGFEPPHEWRLPPAWLEPFAASRAWGWSLVISHLHRTHHPGRRPQRLVVLHPAGFPVLDVRRRPHMPLRRQLAAELAPYRGLYRLRRVPHILSPPGSAAPSISRWLGWLLAYASARLRRALGWRSPACLARRLLAQPASLSLSAARLDVTFPLETHPLEIRLAGLDRDLGWLPAAGCSIFYHYE